MKRDESRWVQYVCEECGKDTETRKIYYNRRKHHFCGRECQCKWQRKSRIGANNPYWKGGKKYKYKQVNIKGKVYLEHILIMEKKIGRKIRKGEEVHHIDFNTENNSMENLYLCKDKAEHRAFHRK